MRRPADPKIKAVRQQVSTVKSYPAPVGGWNKRDALAAMKPTDATDLENWFPGTSYCEIRGGNTEHATGLSALAKTLAVYNALDGGNEMFACDDTDIYDVTSSGAATSVVSSGITSGKWQAEQMGNGTNNYLMLFNGVDSPHYYDGTNWIVVTGVSSPALTGISDPKKIITSMVHKGRLFVNEVNQLSFWYLGAGAVGGALTKFDLSAIAKKGGYLMAMSTWTLDGGNGPDDLAVFITSEGEIIVYQGNNPSSANSWALVGIYDVGKPLGRRCVHRLGGDLIILTENGAFPMAAALQSNTIDYKMALSFKIEDAFTTAARTYGSNFGWRINILPNRSAMLVNIPLIEGTSHEQYVMNTITKSWCKFTGWNAEDMVVFNGDLYFSSGTSIFKAWNGTSDNGNAIVAYGRTAFSYFNDRQQKQFKMFRPVIATNGTVQFLTDIDIDFKDDIISGTATYSVTAGAVWDVDNWDDCTWAQGLEIVKNWTSPREYMGYSAAGKIKITTNSLTIQWFSCDYIYETGGIF